MDILKQIGTVAIGIMFFGGFSFIVTILLIKLQTKLLFFLPALFGLIAIVFWILGLLSEDFGALGYLIYGSIAIIATVGASISSFLIYLIYIKNKNQS